MTLSEPADESLCAAVPTGHGLGRPGTPVNSQTRAGVQSLGLCLTARSHGGPSPGPSLSSRPGPGSAWGTLSCAPASPSSAPSVLGLPSRSGGRRWGPRQVRTGRVRTGQGDLQTAALPLSLADPRSHQGTSLYPLLLFSASTGSEKYHRSFSASENTHFKNQNGVQERSV